MRQPKLDPDQEPDVRGSGRVRSPSGTAWDAALRYLGLRSHSRFEIEQKLTRRGYPEDEICMVLKRLAKVGLLDDEQFARELTASLLSSKSASRRDIARQLAKRGVSPDIATSVLENISAADEASRALTLADKKMRQLLGVTQDVRWRRTLAYLARRGFSQGECYTAVRTVEENLAEEGLANG